MNNLIERIKSQNAVEEIDIDSESFELNEESLSELEKTIKEGELYVDLLG